MNEQRDNKAFERLRLKASRVLAMNRRNLDYIYPYNMRKDYPLADNKLKAKEVLVPAGVPMPRTYRTYSGFYELRGLGSDLGKYEDFVIKPAAGTGGGGIIAISGRRDDAWTGLDGRLYGLAALKKHISDIIFGVYSFDLYDKAIIEERVVQSEQMEALSPFGMADIRLITFEGREVMAMLRIPTRLSGGRANLHQGSVGVGVEIGSGRTTNAMLKGVPVSAHPDTGVELTGRTLSGWGRVVETARLAADSVPLEYLGVDVAISMGGPVVLEINVRPGLEIQNVNMEGLRVLLEGAAGSGRAR